MPVWSIRDRIEQGEWRDVEPSCAAPCADQQENCVRLPAERSNMLSSGGEAVDWGWAEVDWGRNTPLSRFLVACGGDILPPRQMDQSAIREMSG
jgi:hypothetical protein